MEISVIIPAYNAASTLVETLDSVRAQSFTRWEAIIIDDGSNDGTADLARSFVEGDSRFRIIQGGHGGVSAARNIGILHAKYDWLLFLDADDLLLPQHLEHLSAAVAADPTLDAVYCGWERLTPAGKRIEENCWYELGDLFHTLARLSAFPIHTCIVRKSLVKSAGGWDTSFKVCEDWDVWQRIARTGARFGVVREVLAIYRMNVGSTSMDGFQMFADGLRVMRQGHSQDQRVANPHPAHRNGLPEELLADQKIYYLSWCAGLAIGQGKDPTPMLDMIAGSNGMEPSPEVVADSIFRAVPLSAGVDYNAWCEIWGDLEQPIDAFLTTMEKYLKANRWVRRVRNALEAVILDHAPPEHPATAGLTHAVHINIENPIPDINPPQGTERLRCTIDLLGGKIGILDLPVFDGLVPRYVLADAISDQFAWEILNQFFQASLYTQFKVEKNDDGLSVWRGGICLTEGLPEGKDTLARHLHERAGWTLFLQEVWGHPDKTPDWFYNPAEAEDGAPRRKDERGRLAVDAADELPDVECSTQELNVTFSVGGSAIGVVTVPTQDGTVRAHQLRVALIRASGFELCRAAVRDGVLGRPLHDPATLHQRLADTRQCTRQQVDTEWSIQASEVDEYTEDWQRAIRQALSPGERGVIIPRRLGVEIDTSVSRRAVFPSSLYTEIREAAAALSEPILHVESPEGQPTRAIYAPDLLWIPARGGAVSHVGQGLTRQAVLNEARPHGRFEFETIFAGMADPWQYTSPYEQIKYEQTLTFLPAGRVRNALEIGCAEGHFTTQLAPRVDSLTAADISRVALERASHRCTAMNNIRFLSFDLTRDPLPGRFDLIVCSETLYYVGSDREALKAVANKIVEALEPGGHLLMAHANLVVDEPDKPGFNWDHPFGAKVIGEVFLGTGRLRLVKELRTPLYRIQLFQRKPRIQLSLGQKPAQIIELSHQPALPPPGADVQVLWQGGSPVPYGEDQIIETDRLPILMYHRVAPEGGAALAPYRVTPEIFEEQLRYLRDSGYYSVSLEDWQAAMAEHKPLPGRAILLTFDDGYRDLMIYAWPLLEKYGFSAIIFLVAGEIGGTNRWDHRFGEEIPLLGWDEIQELSTHGIQFGSHSTSHPLLTAIPPTEVVREAIRSRRIIEQGLKMPVRAFAFPHGGEDQVVRHIVGACGYIFGLSTQPGRCGLWAPLLALPRIEVSGSDRLNDFIAKLAEREPHRTHG